MLWQRCDVTVSCPLDLLPMYPIWHPVFQCLHLLSGTFHLFHPLRLWPTLSPIMSNIGLLPSLHHFQPLSQLLDSVRAPGHIHSKDCCSTVVSKFLTEVHSLPTLFSTTYVDGLFGETYRFLAEQPDHQRPSPADLRDFAERYSFLTRHRALLDTSSLLASAENSLHDVQNTYRDIINSFTASRLCVIPPEYEAANKNVKARTKMVQDYQTFCDDAVKACKCCHQRPPRNLT